MYSGNCESVYICICMYETVRVYVRDAYKKEEESGEVEWKGERDDSYARSPSI